MAEDYGETLDDTASSEEEGLGTGGGTDAPGRVRMLGKVGQAGEGDEWAGDDVRSVGEGEGLCVTTLNLRRFGSGPTAYEDQGTRVGEDGVEEARRWGAVMKFGDANLRSPFA